MKTVCPSNAPPPNHAERTAALPAQPCRIPPLSAFQKEPFFRTSQIVSDRLRSSGIVPDRSTAPPPTTRYSPRIVEMFARFLLPNRQKSASFLVVSRQSASKRVVSRQSASKRVISRQKHNRASPGLTRAKIRADSQKLAAKDQHQRPHIREGRSVNGRLWTTIDAITRHNERIPFQKGRSLETMLRRQRHAKTAQPSRPG